uniref:Uncharacterized protein n=1 Tax=Arundo donax TaxID=35708 RepID=A0A0A9H1F3_ARUDO
MCLRFSQFSISPMFCCGPLKLCLPPIMKGYICCN